MAGTQDNLVSGIGNKEVLASLNVIWRDKRYDYTSGNMDYMGVNTYHAAATTDTDWEIWKFTYDVDKNTVRIQGPLQGSWDNRAALGW